MSWDYGGYPEYVSVGEKRAKAEKKIKQLKKKNPDLKPISIEGKALAKTWWGKEWNKNLERYADYGNRIGRGRSYVRHKAVLDLQLEPGHVKSLVMGSRSKPYAVTIKIKAIPKANWQRMKKACLGKLESLQKLLAGKFPKALSELFTTRADGLFPVPEEISFSCSCPDYAYMCKHVAATLYGIGARLDEDPALFFKLRKANVKDLISEAVEDSKKNLLKKSEIKTSRVIDDSDLSSVFGIDLETPSSSTGKAKAPNKKSSVSFPKAVTKKQNKKRRKSDSKTGSPIKLSAKVKKKTQKNTKKSNKNDSPADIIENMIKRHKKGVNAAKLEEKSGIDIKKIRNIIARLKAKGKIKNKSRGIYVMSGDRNST